MIDYTSWANHYPNPRQIQLNPIRKQLTKMKAFLSGFTIRTIPFEPLDTIKDNE